LCQPANRALGPELGSGHPVKTVIRNGARVWLLINMQQDRGSAGENA
jgi:hypothetical protein